jgi:hypothetical protein
VPQRFLVSDVRWAVWKCTVWFSGIRSHVLHPVQKCRALFADSFRKPITVLNGASHCHCYICFYIVDLGRLRAAKTRNDWLALYGIFWWALQAVLSPVCAPHVCLCTASTAPGLLDGVL